MLESLCSVHKHYVLGQVKNKCSKWDIYWRDKSHLKELSKISVAKKKNLWMKWKNAIESTWNKAEQTEDRINEMIGILK